MRAHTHTHTHTHTTHTEKMQLIVQTHSPFPEVLQIVLSLNVITSSLVECYSGATVSIYSNAQD